MKNNWIRGMISGVVLGVLLAGCAGQNQPSETQSQGEASVSKDSQEEKWTFTVGFEAE